MQESTYPYRLPKSITGIGQTTNKFQTNTRMEFVPTRVCALECGQIFCLIQLFFLDIRQPNLIFIWHSSSNMHVEGYSSFKIHLCLIVLNLRCDLIIFFYWWMFIHYFVLNVQLFQLVWDQKFYRRQMLNTRNVV